MSEVLCSWSSLIFTNWHAVLKIDIANGCLSDLAIAENCNGGLACNAAICQMNGLMLILEPEILMDGKHDLKVAQAVTQREWSLH